MFSKAVITSLTLVAAFPALAEFQPTGKTASLHCQGSKGELTIEADQQQKSFKLAIVVNGKTKLIEIDGITAAKVHAEADVSLTSFTYEDSANDGVSIDASFTKPKWFPAEDFCAPTRVTDKCFQVHQEGYWGKAFFNGVGLGFKVNPNNKNTYSLTSLRAESYGIEGSGQNPLGENVLCTGELL